MLSDLYTPKQLDTFHFAVNNDYFMLINHGAKRTGKTVLDNDLFLYELRRIKKIAAAQGVENPQYILAGADLGALNRNVLIERLPMGVKTTPGTNTVICVLDRSMGFIRRHSAVGSMT